MTKLLYPENVISITILNVICITKWKFELFDIKAHFLNQNLQI